MKPKADRPIDLNLERVPMTYDDMLVFLQSGLGVDVTIIPAQRQPWRREHAD